MAGQRKRIKLGRAPLGNFPSQGKRGNGRQLVEISVPAFSYIRRFVNVDGRRRRLSRNRREILLDQLTRLGLVKVPGDRQHGVVRRIVNSKELANVIDSRD